MNGSTQRSMCAAMLVLQAVVLFLTGVATIGMTDIGTGASLSLGLGLAVLCVIAAGLLPHRVGYALGWLVQVVSIGLGFVTTPMFFLGVVFAALWVAAVRPRRAGSTGSRPSGPCSRRSGRRSTAPE